MFSRDRHVRIERVALEHHGDVAVARLQPRDVAIADQHAPAGRQFEPGEDAQRRRLAAARRAEQGQEAWSGTARFEGEGSTLMGAEAFLAPLRSGRCS